MCITGENGGKIRQLVPKTAAAVAEGDGSGSWELRSDPLEV